MTESVSLSSSDKDVIERQLDASGQVAESHFGGRSLEDVFEVDRCVRWAEEKALQRMALQFPDGLLKFAPRVATTLEERLGKRVAVLGDTSYGDCCVDEVAAEHVGCDGIVHFGNSCLTSTQRLPVLCVFTILPIDVTDLATQLRQSEDLQGKTVFLFYDVRYHRSLDEEKALLPENVHLCEPCSSAAAKCGRSVPKETVAGDVVVYVGNSEKYALILALNFSGLKHLAYDPMSKTLTDSTFACVEKELRKRSFLIEKARGASRVGVLVGTLGATKYRDVMDRVLLSVRESGKKAYMFLVGKPNVPKLANFPEIDIFVVIACAENSVVGAKEFFQPVITPFELDIALNSRRVWTTEFTSDFRDILPGGKNFVDFAKGDGGMSGVSLISGKVLQSISTNTDQAEDSSDAALATQERNVAVLHQEGGGQFLGQRSWQGLEQKLGETPVEMAVKGLSGIAFGYDGEGQ